MHVELISITPDADILIERAARCCYATSPDTSARRSFIRNLIKNKHLTPLEHASATFIIDGISRSCAGQLCRHRHLSICQESQRYVRADAGDFTSNIPHDTPEEAKVFAILKEIQNLYEGLLNAGIPREDARAILPNGCVTKLVVTGNFRAWLEVFEKRISPYAQLEIRRLCMRIWEILVSQYPSVFERDTYCFSMDEGMLL
jgi:thymidylate synthase (FAD)